jgi:hypothetical protein
MSWFSDAVDLAGDVVSSVAAEDTFGSTYEANADCVLTHNT